MASKPIHVVPRRSFRCWNCDTHNIFRSDRLPADPVIVRGKDVATQTEFSASEAADASGNAKWARKAVASHDAAPAGTPGCLLDQIMEPPGTPRYLLDQIVEPLFQRVVYGNLDVSRLSTAHPQVTHVERLVDGRVQIIPFTELPKFTISLSGEFRLNNARISR